MAEYDRIQKKQESRAVANNDTGSRQLRGFVNNNTLSKEYSFDSAQTSLGKLQNIENSLIQRTVISTPHGDFEDTKNELINDEEELNFELVFKPKKETNATKIGLVQATKEVIGGDAIAIDPNTATKMSDAGYSIDQLSDNPNPLYATVQTLVSETSDKTKLADYKTDTDFGQHAIKEGDAWTQNAILKDSPTTNKDIPNTKEVFETTALAIDGAEKDKYYGSITWGCHTDGSGKVTKHEIALEAIDTPSENFIGAAKKWNAGKTRGSLKVKNAITIDEVKLEEDYPNTGKQLSLDEGCLLKQKDTVDDEGVPSLIVKVLDGANKNKLGCIAVKDVEDINNGADTVKLPIPYVLDWTDYADVAD